MSERGKSLKIHLDGLMTPWVYNEKFPVGTQFLFGTLMFNVGEDENLELKVRGLPPRQWAPIYGEAPYGRTGPSSTITSTSDDICSALNPYAGSYILATMTSQGYPIRVPIFQPSPGTSSSTSSGASTDRDVIEDYLEIGGIIYWNPVTEAHRINMVGPGRAAYRNSSSRYPMISGFEAFDA
jgi:hypothetical protein